jgi:hypothetical protein
MLEPLRGSGFLGGRGTGGVASLNHRLQAVIPPGWRDQRPEARGQRPEAGKRREFVVVLKKGVLGGFEPGGVT